MNDFEKRLKEDLEKRNPGCLVLRNGWPDFLVYNPETGQIKGVEGKDRGDTLRAHQDKLHKILRSAGVPVEVWYRCGEDYIVKGGENVIV